MRILELKAAIARCAVQSECSPAQPSCSWPGAAPAGTTCQLPLLRQLLPQPTLQSRLFSCAGLSFTWPGAAKQQLRDLIFCPLLTSHPACPSSVQVSFTWPGATKQQLSDVTCRVSLGSRVAVLGANGAGKSTLIKLLTGAGKIEGRHQRQSAQLAVVSVACVLPGRALCCFLFSCKQAAFKIVTTLTSLPFPQARRCPTRAWCASTPTLPLSIHCFKPFTALLTSCRRDPAGRGLGVEAPQPAARLRGAGKLLIVVCVWTRSFYLKT